MEELLKELVGKKVVYSATGGGVGSIILLIVDNKKYGNNIWTWCYWEIYRGDELLATADDDMTPITGKMAVAAHALEGETVKEVYLDSEYNLMVLFSNDLQLYLYRDAYEIDENDEDYEESWEYRIPHLDIVYLVMRNKEIRKRKYYRSEKSNDEK